MHQSIPAAPTPPFPLRGICLPCQSRGWRICKFCASRGPDICQARGQPRAFDTYAVNSHASAKISPVGAFPCLPYAFPLLICISVFLRTNVGSSRILIQCLPPYLIKCLPPYIMKWKVVSFLLEEHNRNNRLA